MTWETLIQRIKDRKCQTAVEPFARNLVDAFGIRFDNLTQEPDLTQGVERAYPFVGEACSLFENPRPVFTITPFAYAYLGTDSFAQVWDIIKQRVTAHPEEQGYLDEVFSAATLLSPTLRPAFLESVRDAAYIGEDMFGLDDILQTVDPSITQSAADLPAEIVDNKNLSHAQRILGAYLQAGLFHPQTGFVKEFPALFKSMQGFRYLLHNPNDAMALVVADDKTWKRIQLEVQHNPPLLHVDAYNTRYGLNEEHPGIVLVTQSVEPAKVQALYPESTLVYTGIDRNAQNILEALPNRMMFIPYGPSTLASALQFISVQRQGGQRNFRAMVDQELGKARFELQKGSGDYYTPANLLESIGKKDALEAMVAETGLPLPRVADKAYVLIVTEDTFVADLKTFTNGRQYSIDVVREAKAQKRPPFMVLVNSPVPLAELQKMYPYAGILYIAKNNAEEQAYAKLNPKGTAFTVNLSHLSIRGSDIHEWIGYTLLPRIAQGLTEAKTDVLEAVETIGEEARKLRGEILFAPSIRSYWELARQYYNLQTAFGPMPELIQTGDTALMLACPTGGCFRLDKPYSGGCWSSGNMPDALIEFAIAYRRSIGDDGFKDQLMAYNQGNLAEPWYARTYIYQKAFAGEFKRGLTAPVQKRDDLEF